MKKSHVNALGCTWLLYSVGGMFAIAYGLANFRWWTIPAILTGVFTWWAFAFVIHDLREP